MGHTMTATHPPAVPLESLLAQRQWLCALAHSLVRDASLAADLEQEVWLSALERPPRATGSLRAWLRRVLVSRWRDVQRSEAARGARERSVAPQGAAPAAAELVARVDVQRRVAEAVLDLEEPHRTTVLLRYFEELPLREVARRMSVPYETARARHVRALASLRGALREPDPERRRALRDALVALAALGAGSGGQAGRAVATSGGIMLTKLLIPIAASLGIGAGGGWMLKPDEAGRAADLEAQLRTVKTERTALVTENEGLRERESELDAERERARETAGDSGPSPDEIERAKAEWERRENLRARELEEQMKRHLHEHLRELHQRLRREAAESWPDDPEQQKAFLRRLGVDRR